MGNGQWYEYHYKTTISEGSVGYISWGGQVCGDKGYYCISGFEIIFWECGNTLLSDRVEVEIVVVVKPTLYHFIQN